MIEAAVLPDSTWIGPVGLLATNRSGVMAPVVEGLALVVGATLLVGVTMLWVGVATFRAEVLAPGLEVSAKGLDVPALGVAAVVATVID